MDVPVPLTEEDLEKIEIRMQELIAKDLVFVSEKWSKEKALDYFGKKGEIYKCEIIERIGCQANVYDWY